MMLAAGSPGAVWLVGHVHTPAAFSRLKTQIDRWGFTIATTPWLLAAVAHNAHSLPPSQATRAWACMAVLGMGW
jgi:hypothetical protein